MTTDSTNRKMGITKYGGCIFIPVTAIAMGGLSMHPAVLMAISDFEINYFLSVWHSGGNAVIYVPGSMPNFILYLQYHAIFFENGHHMSAQNGKKIRART